VSLHAVLVAFAVAVAAAQQVPQLPARVVSVSMLGLAALAFAWWRQWPARFRTLVFLLVAVLAGLGYTWLRAEWRLVDALPTSLEGREIMIIGVIDGLPERQQDSVRFPFRIESAPGLQAARRRGFHWPGGCRAAVN
jgi:hypothetical protein